MKPSAFSTRCSSGATPAFADFVLSRETDGRRGQKRSAAAYARMAAVQRARWEEKVKSPVVVTKASPKAAAKAAPAASVKKRTRNFSPEALARISAAAKARWAIVKASDKRWLG